MKRHSFSFTLTAEQQAQLQKLLHEGNYRPLHLPYTRAAAAGPDCTIALYLSGKCLVQGSGAADWVTYVLEPEILREVRLGYEAVLHPEASAPHMGVDESGKGDFFGPLVIAAAYVDPALAKAFEALNVRDSKRVTSDRVAEQLALDIRRLLDHRYSLVVIGPRAYNRLYARLRNVNRILAWGHARAIENLLAAVPDCPRALSDQFGPKRQIEQALLQQGRRLQLEQRPRAESDPAVAAASLLARAGFLRALRELQEKYGCAIPKGAAAQVQAAARQLVDKQGPQVLLDAAKCHFRTADAVLAQLHLNRGALGPEGAAVSRPTLRGRHETGALRTEG